MFDESIKWLGWHPLGWEYKTINISELLYSEFHLDEERSYEDASDNI